MQNPPRMLSCIDPIGAVSVERINDQQTKASSDDDTRGRVRIYCVRNPCFINSVITCSAERVNFITHFLSPEQDLCTSPVPWGSSFFFCFVSFSGAPWLSHSLFRLCAGRRALKYHCLASETGKWHPRSRTTVLGYRSSSGERKPEVRLLYWCVP